MRVRDYSCSGMAKHLHNTSHKLSINSQKASPINHHLTNQSPQSDHMTKRLAQIGSLGLILKLLTNECVESIHVTKRAFLIGSCMWSDSIDLHINHHYAGYPHAVTASSCSRSQPNRSRSRLVWQREERWRYLLDKDFHRLNIFNAFPICLYGKNRPSKTWLKSLHIITMFKHMYIYVFATIH